MEWPKYGVSGEILLLMYDYGWQCLSIPEIRSIGILLMDDIIILTSFLQYMYT